MDELDSAARYRDEVRSLVCQTFHLSPDQVDMSTPFDELGVNSRRRVRLLATVETHFGISVGVDVLDRLTDVDGVARVVAEALDAGDRAS